ncbi:uncharacterized protein LOC141668487 [Apium graveolens]|uniref:uncharacterized protein LOC141668487 n=1 Tax=Apium graveolens TaxID=4045 RepID=UPI003D793FA6
MMEPRVQENVKLGKKAIDPYDLAEKNACLPSELRCLIYTKYMKEAMIIPCCHQSFCERCIPESVLRRYVPDEESVIQGNNISTAVPLYQMRQNNILYPSEFLLWMFQLLILLSGWKRRLLTIKLKPLLRRSLRETSRESWVTPKMMWFPQILFVTASPEWWT